MVLPCTSLQDISPGLQAHARTGAGAILDASGGAGRGCHARVGAVCVIFFCIGVFGRVCACGRSGRHRCRVRLNADHQQLLS